MTTQTTDATVKAGDQVRYRWEMNPSRVGRVYEVVRVWVPRYGRGSAKGPSDGDLMARVRFGEMVDAYPVDTLEIVGGRS